jgi:type II secretory pathway pseudopilin PulG
MLGSLHRSRASRATGAFTLIEIVLVIAILATMSGLVIASMQGVEERATSNITTHELNEVRRAVQQFRADTGFMPKRGPFNLVTRPQDGGAVPVPTFPGGEGEVWFDAPANLTQLFECPLPSTHPLATWDAGRRRGWRGPYLVRGVDGRVVMARLSADGTGWTSGSLLPSFLGVADPYLHEVHATFGYQWSTTTGGPVETRHGRPVFLFDLDPGAPGPADDRDVNGLDLVAQLARVVSCGQDGRYDPVVTGQCVAPGSDDVGLFLLR